MYKRQLKNQLCVLDIGLNFQQTVECRHNFTDSALSRSAWSLKFEEANKRSGKTHGNARIKFVSGNPVITLYFIFMASAITENILNVRTLVEVTNGNIFKLFHRKVT